MPDEKEKVSLEKDSQPKTEKIKKKSPKLILILISAILVIFVIVMVSFDNSDSGGEGKKVGSSVNKNTEDSKSTNPVSDNTTSDSMKDTTTSSPKSQNIDVEVLAEYTLSDGIGWYTRHFMIIKNNSDITVDVSTSSLAYGEDGAMVSAADSSFDALGTGCTSVLYEAFETDKKINRYETDINATKSEYYKSVIQDLSYTQNDIDGGAIFQVTNNGEEAAEFVEGHALFFLNGELVSYESTYFTDDDSELKPGKTISKQLTAYEEFDKIEFYLTGRKSKY